MAAKKVVIGVLAAALIGGGGFLIYKAFQKPPTPPGPGPEPEPPSPEDTHTINLKKGVAYTISNNMQLTSSSPLFMHWKLRVDKNRMSLYSFEKKKYMTDSGWSDLEVFTDENTYTHEGNFIIKFNGNCLTATSDTTLEFMDCSKSMFATENQTFAATKSQ